MKIALALMALVAFTMASDVDDFEKALVDVADPSDAAAAKMVRGMALVVLEYKCAVGAADCEALRALEAQADGPHGAAGVAAADAGMAGENFATIDAGRAAAVALICETEPAKCADWTAFQADAEAWESDLASSDVDDFEKTLADVADPADAAAAKMVRGMALVVLKYKCAVGAADCEALRALEKQADGPHGAAGVAAADAVMAGENFATIDAGRAAAVALICETEPEKCDDWMAFKADAEAWEADL